jgi:P27 family predicted phage terminase small subunit
MPTPGRKPKPAAQRRREGNPGRRPIKESFEATGAPEKPVGLGPEAEQEWDRIVPALVQAGIVGRVDAGTLTALCVQWGVAERARKVVAEEGLVEVGSTGQMVEHAMLKTMNAAYDRYVRIATEFGLTPSARARAEQAKAGQPLDVFEDVLGPPLRLVGGGKS